MKDKFKDILAMEDVKGVVWISFDGETLFREFSPGMGVGTENIPWREFFEGELEGVREADLVFEKGRVYIRKTDAGYLMVLTGNLAPGAMIRLNCDILLPSLKDAGAGRGLKRLFRKRR